MEIPSLLMDTPELEKRLSTLPLEAHLMHSIFKQIDRKSTRLNSSHLVISYAVFCLKKKKKKNKKNNKKQKKKKKKKHPTNQQDKHAVTT